MKGNKELLVGQLERAFINRSSPRKQGESNTKTTSINKLPSLGQITHHKAL